MTITSVQGTPYEALLSPDQTQALAELIEPVRAGWDEAPGALKAPLGDYKSAMPPAAASAPPAAPPRPKRGRPPGKLLE